MSSFIKVRNMVLGNGIPKVCIPLTDTNLEDLKKSISHIQDSPFDFIEWRADFYENMDSPAVREEAVALFRSYLGDTPVLFTIRTSLEGGMLEIDTKQYVQIISDVAQSGLVDMVDVELSRGENAMKTILETAHKSGVKVIASRHDFHRTPDKAAIVECLCQMQDLGADVVKFAVMPTCERDVLTLLDATLTMKEEHYHTPVITMSMGPLGVVSRLAGGLFGSAVTFGTVGKASAPGQIPAGRLAEILEVLG